jgi:hypothetical protein
MNGLVSQRESEIRPSNSAVQEWTAAVRPVKHRQGPVLAA